MGGPPRLGRWPCKPGSMRLQAVLHVKKRRGGCLLDLTNARQARQGAAGKEISCCPCVRVADQVRVGCSEDSVRDSQPPPKFQRPRQRFCLVEIRSHHLPSPYFFSVAHPSMAKLCKKGRVL